MTDEVELIHRRIEEIKANTKDKQFASPYNTGRVDLCNELLSLIDSMQEEPISEDLENAGKMMELTRFDGYAMLDAIEFGAKWQKDHLMKDAVNARCFGFQSGEALFSIKLPADKYLVGSEIKVVIIKED